MKRKYAYMIVAALSMLTCFGSYGEDTVPVKELNEIVVNADRGWVEPGKIVIIPTKSEKKLSNTPADLVKSMNFPGLTVSEGGEITGPDKAVATVFINGKRADEIDEGTFWAMQVKKVEFLQNPEDPRFQGCPNVVNFVVEEFKTGGVTKLSTNFMTPVMSSNKVTSKLVYKKMTYSLMLTDIYWDLGKTRKEASETYSDMFYNGIHYDAIERNMNETKKDRSNYLGGVFKAVYEDDKFMAAHSVSYAYDKQICKLEESKDSWTYNLFNSNESYSDSRGHYNTFNVNGEYLWSLGPKWRFFSSWGYNHSEDDMNSESRTGLANPIFSPYKDKSNSGSLSILAAFKPSEKIYLQLMAAASLNRFNIEYTGDNHATSEQARENYTGMLRFYWTPSSKVSFSLYPGISISHWKSNGVNNTSVLPTGNLWLGINPGKKYNFSFSTRYTVDSPLTSEISDVMVKNSELIWLKGNPDLKRTSRIYLNMAHTYIPANWLNGVFSIYYYNHFNEISEFYTSAPSELGGLIKSYKNYGSNGYLDISLQGNFSLLDNKLNLSAKPSWNYFHYPHKDLNTLSYSVNVSYTLGNFRFGCYYSRFPGSMAKKAGNDIFKRSDLYNFDITYGTGNLYVKLIARNIFSRHSEYWGHYTAGNYRSDYTEYEIGNRLRIEFSYTFSYGKKVSKNIDIDENIQRESGALK